MDAASSEFYNKEDGKYHLSGEGVVKTSAEMVDWYEELFLNTQSSLSKTDLTKTTGKATNF
jgi:enolase